MDHKVLGDILPAVEIRLQVREVMYTQSGGIAWMSDGFTLDSNVRGGLMKGLGRMFSGESLFMATYTAPRPGSTIVFASTASGKILAIDMVKTSLICQKEAFLRAQTTAGISTVLTKEFTTGFFDGEGFILQQIQGSGMAFLEVDGDVVERALTPGEVIKVDMGNASAFEPGISHEVKTVKGVKNILFGGEGLFLTKLTGPGRVHMQTMNTVEFTGRITQGFPTSK